MSTYALLCCTLSLIQFIVGIGVLVSNVVCFSLWRGNATAKLQGEINKTLDSFATLITMLSKTFLLEEEATTSAEQLKKAITAHETSFTGLKTSLTDAKLELLDPRIQRAANEYDEIVQIMTRLAQNLTGLRSGCTLQNDILRARRQGRHTDTIAPSSSHDVMAAHTHQALQIKNQPDDQVAVFEQFKKHCSPKMIHLTNTARNVLKELRTSFIYSRAGAHTFKEGSASDSSSDTSQASTLRNLRADLKTALAEFNLSHTRALKRLYRHYPTQERPDPARGESTHEESHRPAIGADRPNEAILTLYL